MTYNNFCRRNGRQCPGVAQFGSALEWGSRGREFDSRHSDQIPQRLSSAVFLFVLLKVFKAGYSFQRLRFALNGRPRRGFSTARGVTTLDEFSATGGLCPGRGGLILHWGSSFDRLHLSRLGSSSTFPVSGIFFLSSAT